MAMRSTRAGQPTANISAIYAPQSCPATENAPMPRVSNISITSRTSLAALPVRGVSGDRKRVSPKPRVVGAIVRNPASLRIGIMASQVEESSGQP
jgi:hypothetical protein